MKKYTNPEIHFITYVITDIITSSLNDGSDPFDYAKDEWAKALGL